MGIKLDISRETPLSDDDRDILAGLSVMVLAIANRQNLADQDVPPRPCNDQQGQAFCMKPEGHDGDHRFDGLDGLDDPAQPPSTTMN